MNFISTCNSWLKVYDMLMKTIMVTTTATATTMMASDSHATLAQTCKVYAVLDMNEASAVIVHDSNSPFY